MFGVSPQVIIKPISRLSLLVEVNYVKRCSLSLSLPTKDPLSPITKANSGNCLKQTKAAATAAIVSVACYCCFCCCFGSCVAPTTWQLHKQLKLHTLCYTHLSIPLSPALHALYSLHHLLVRYACVSRNTTRFSTSLILSFMANMRNSRHSAM